MAIEIREALPGSFSASELGRLGEIVVAAYDAVGALAGDDEYVPELRDVARRAREAVVLAAVDIETRQLLGCVTYVPDASSPWAEHLREGEAGIRMLAVDPAGQGRGVGTALIGACLDRARARHASTRAVPTPRPCAAGSTASIRIDASPPRRCSAQGFAGSGTYVTQPSTVPASSSTAASTTASRARRATSRSTGT
jgi:GNAT superfamily N-acetyltransferase